MNSPLQDAWRARVHDRSFGQIRVLKSDPYFDPDKGENVEFRLTYEGLLFGSAQDALAGQPVGRAAHKHAIRKGFHKQLKQFWEINPYLKHGYPVKFDWKSQSIPKGGVTYGCSIAENVAAKYQRCGFRFVPLVLEEYSLICSLDILFLRPDRPGALLKSGDIDNRLKTLFDALRMPKNSDETGSATPDADEDPFYCLLEDDSLITHVAVETDVLLQPTGAQQDPNDCRLVISVKLRPYNSSPANEGFL